MRRSRLRLSAVSAVASLFAFGGRLAAQERSGAARPEWGTKDRIFTHVGFNDFAPAASFFSYDGSFSRYSTVPNGVFWATAFVTSGALLTHLEFDYCDTDATSNTQLVLWDCSYLGENCNILGNLLSSGSPGCSLLTQDLTPSNYTMDNNVRELIVEGITQSGSATNQILGAYIGYKLQLRPAPASATFGDVPRTHPYFRAIEALAASGIASGCGGGNFCPNQPVTRGEMAKFLANALGLHFPN